MKPVTCAEQARAITAQLAHAAAQGPVGQLTVLAYTSRMRRLLETLGECEELSDLLVAQDHHVEAALANGDTKIVPHPSRALLVPGGGRAA